MQPILLGEYRNQNSRRNYPFRDGASLTDQTGVVLPTDFLIDAYIFPIVLRESDTDLRVTQPIGDSIFISKIDLTERKIYINSVLSGVVYGIAEFEEGVYTAYVYEEPNYHRQIGVLVFGDGLTAVLHGAPVRTFVPWATSFTPSTFTILDQVGVRGFLLEDGSLITGDVIIEGQDGIEITSYISGGSNTLKFEVTGQAPAKEACAPSQCPFIKEICFERADDSEFMIAQQSTNTVNLNAFGFTLDDICAAQKAQVLPDEDGNLPAAPKAGDDPCGTIPTPPVPPTPVVTAPICFTLEGLGGNIFIMTPSAPGARNPVGVKEVDQSGSQSLVRIIQDKPIAGYQEITELTNQVATPPYLAGGLVVYFKGLRTQKRN